MSKLSKAHADVEKEPLTAVTVSKTPMADPVPASLLRTFPKWYRVAKLWFMGESQHCIYQGATQPSAAYELLTSTRYCPLHKRYLYTQETRGGRHADSSAPA